MPIDYKKYPKNWLSEIRPRIMKRSGNSCEGDGCRFTHGQVVYAVKYKGRSTWYESFEEADKQPKSFEIKNGSFIRNPKPIKVLLAIAHLDHDELNHEVKDERLKALCQRCHLRHDAKEKYKRVNSKRKLN